MITNGIITICKRGLWLALFACSITLIPAMAQTPGNAISTYHFASLSRGMGLLAAPAAGRISGPADRAANTNPEPNSASAVAATPARGSGAKKWWVLSAVAITAASLADFGTSMGHNEANPLLQSSNGQFSVARGLSLKLGLASATVLVQALITRHHPDLYKACAIANVAGAGAFSAVAAHNANTPR